MMDLFCILIVVVVMSVYNLSTFIELYTLKVERFYCLKLYLNDADFKKTTGKSWLSKH